MQRPVAGQCLSTQQREASTSLLLFVSPINPQNLEKAKSEEYPKKGLTAYIMVD